MTVRPPKPNRLFVTGTAGVIMASFLMAVAMGAASAGRQRRSKSARPTRAHRPSPPSGPATPGACWRTPTARPRP